MKTYRVTNAQKVGRMICKILGEDIEGISHIDIFLTLKENEAQINIYQELTQKQEDAFVESLSELSTGM